jgi:hypothetical protein
MTERHNQTRHHGEYASDKSSISFSKKIQRTRKTFKDDVNSVLLSSSDKSTTTTHRRKTNTAGKRTTPRKPDQKETGTKTKTPRTSDKRDKKQNRRNDNKRRNRIDLTKHNNQAQNITGENSDTDSKSQRLGNKGDKQRTIRTTTQHQKQGKTCEKTESSDELSIRHKRPNWKGKRRINMTTSDDEVQDKHMQLNKKGNKDNKSSE